MALKKTDCLLLLTELQENGYDVDDQIQKLLLSTTLPLDVIKFINDKRQFDVAAFYEKLRKSYNNRKSDLYINIVKEIDDTTKVLTTLSSLLTQILLYSENTKKCDNKQLFLQHSRAKEISLALTKYFENYDITICLQLLRLIKADIKSLEQLQNN